MDVLPSTWLKMSISCSRTSKALAKFIAPLRLQAKVSSHGDNYHYLGWVTEVGQLDNYTTPRESTIKCGDINQYQHKTPCHGVHNELETSGQIPARDSDAHRKAWHFHHCYADRIVSGGC